MKPTILHTRSLAVGIALAAALTLGGCGGDDDGDEPRGDSSTSAGQSDDQTGDQSAATDPTSSPDTASSDATTTSPKGGKNTAGDDPATAAEAILTAYTQGDADTACGLQTKAYETREIKKAIDDGFLKKGATCADLVKAAAAAAKQYGIDTSKGTYTETSNDGSTAKVKVGYPGQDGSSVLVFVKTDGKWLLDSEE